MPTYESPINKDKSLNKILSRFETRLRTPFLLDMETEVSSISDLIFALQSEHSQNLKTYTKEVLEIRSQMLMNKEFMSRRELAKLLAGLLSPAGKLGVLKAVESFRKMEMFKKEMEKPANFNTRQDSNTLLPNERKPNFGVNLAGIKRFYVKSLAQPDPKKPKTEKSDNKKPNPRYRRGNRGRGRYHRPYFTPRNGGVYGNHGFSNQNYGYYNQNNQNSRFHHPNNGQNNTRQDFSEQKLADMRNKACFYCHQPGHAKRNCPVLNSQSSQGNPAKK